MTVGEICNREVVFLEREANILDAARLMRSQHVGDVVIVDRQGQRLLPAGILTDRDIVVALLAEEVDPAKVNVGEVMSAELLTATETDDALATVKRMRAKGVRRMPVVTADGALAGILTVDDLLDLLAEQLEDLVGLIRVEQHRERQRRR